MGLLEEFACERKTLNLVSFAREEISNLAEGRFALRHTELQEHWRLQSVGKGLPSLARWLDRWGHRGLIWNKS